MANLVDEQISRVGPSHWYQEHGTEENIPVCSLTGPEVFRNRDNRSGLEWLLAASPAYWRQNRRLRPSPRFLRRLGNAIFGSGKPAFKGTLIRLDFPQLRNKVN